MRRLKLPEALRDRLKVPVGELIPGPPRRSIVRLKRIILSMKPSKIICVGDFVSKLLLDSYMPVDLVVVDNRSMRRRTRRLRTDSKRTFWVNNPAGTIAAAAWAALSEAIRKQGSMLLVKGEEDLLTLPVIALAPRNALVIYGQPHEGMVAVRVDTPKKTEIVSLISQMKIE